MSDGAHIKALVKEADIYRSQGLFDQSKEKYIELLKFIQCHEQYSKDNKLIAAVKKKIKVVDENLNEIDEASDTPELSEGVQNLISQLFSFSKNKDTAAIEGAVALVKFGQYEKGLTELERLMKQGTMPLLAAKNVLKCQLNFASSEEAIAKFKRWVHREELAKGDLRYLRSFLDDLLKQTGVETDLPQIDGGSSGKEEPEAAGGDDLEITSLSLPLMDGPRKGQEVEFKVSFQSGNTVSLFIPRNQKDLADSFKKGEKISGMQCYTALAFFNVNGVVSEKTTLTSGPKKGDYSIDIVIEEG
ncbi:MAG: hypothetical protein JRI43_08055 [Deltaproteobacteria bacterium]|nr:hypothetical protein [Deltaproteobacteria bacterium]MBW1913095.1 hypothetical protein [Deltaproteobacteria bacterium]